MSFGRRESTNEGYKCSLFTFYILYINVYYILDMKICTKVLNKKGEIIQYTSKQILVIAQPQ